VIRAASRREPGRGAVICASGSGYSAGMRRLAIVAAVLALALAPSAACKKEPSKGLPPATEWSASAGQGSPAAPGAAPAAPQAGEQANPHGPGMAAGGNPHAGMDMSGAGGAGGNPHAGMDMSGAGAAGPTAEKTGPRTLEKLPDGRLALGPFTLAAPAGWTEKPITSSMRAADFVLSTDKGAEAELIVYYFGEGGAGGVQANLDRWLEQFQQPSGKPSKDVAKIEKTTLAGQEATIVSVSGRYVAMAMPGATEAADKADQALLAAIVASPKGPYYFKLVGAKKTVDASAPKLRAMLASLKLR